MSNGIALHEMVEHSNNWYRVRWNSWAWNGTESSETVQREVEWVSPGWKLQELPITVPIPMNMVNTNTVLNGNFRSLDQLQGFIDDPINSKGTAELRMTMRTSTISITIERFLPRTAESTWKCNHYCVGFLWWNNILWNNINSYSWTAANS